MPILLICGASFLLLVFLYNSVIGAANQVENATGSVDAMLKRRFDLIPNLVETVKQYAGHETELLTEITRIRSKAKDKPSRNELLFLNDEFSSVVATLENYPTLRASDNFLHLQRTLNETEEQIAAARRNFNSAVTSYNNKIEMFPTNLFARMLGYQTKDVFIAESIERQPVSVKNLFQ